MENPVIHNDDHRLYEEEPGYKKSIIKRHIGGGLTSASAYLQTYYGELSALWQIMDNKILLTVKVPVITRATIFIPAKNVDSIKGGA